MISTQLANVLGCLALIAYVLTLMPGIFRVIAPSLTRQGGLKQFCKDPEIRRQLGILSFGLALGHAVPIMMNRRFAFLDAETYVFYFHGALSLGILAALAITSNRWSQRKLKKHWKKLHALTYFAMFFLTWHVISAMWGKWSSLTLVMIVLMLVTIGLFLTRRAIEYRRKLSKRPAKDAIPVAIPVGISSANIELPDPANLQQPGLQEGG